MRLFVALSHSSRDFLCNASRSNCERDFMSATPGYCIRSEDPQRSLPDIKGSDPFMQSTSKDEWKIIRRLVYQSTTTGVRSYPLSFYLDMSARSGMRLMKHTVNV